MKYYNIKNIIEKESASELLKNVQVFDVYDGAPIEEGHKNISVRLSFQSDTQTLDDKTVNFLRDKILLELNKNLGVNLRP